MDGKDQVDEMFEKLKQERKESMDRYREQRKLYLVKRIQQHEELPEIGKRKDDAAR